MISLMVVSIYETTTHGWLIIVIAILTQLCYKPCLRRIWHSEKVHPEGCVIVEKSNGIVMDS